MIGEVTETFRAIYVVKSYKADKILVIIDKRSMEYFERLSVNSTLIVLIKRNVFSYTRKEIKMRHKNLLKCVPMVKIVVTKHAILVNGNTKHRKFCVSFNKVATDLNVPSNI